MQRLIFATAIKLMRVTLTAKTGSIAILQKVLPVTNSFDEITLVFPKNLYICIGSLAAYAASLSN